jgi:hypothetical protein
MPTTAYEVPASYDKAKETKEPKPSNSMNKNSMLVGVKSPNFFKLRPLRVQWIKDAIEKGTTMGMLTIVEIVPKITRHCFYFEFKTNPKREYHISKSLKCSN